MIEYTYILKWLIIALFHKCNLQIRTDKFVARQEMKGVWVIVLSFLISSTFGADVRSRKSRHSHKSQKLLKKKAEEDKSVPIEFSSSGDSFDWNIHVRQAGLPAVVTKCVRKGDLALTFDDGVSAVTLDVLAMLKREGVKGTFFVIGNTLENYRIAGRAPAEVMKMIIDDGHEVGSHTYSHPNFDNYWPEGITCEMNKAGGLIKDAIGKTPRIMRPPYGNASQRTIQALHDLGYFIVNWNVDTNDWAHKYAPDQAVQEFASKVPTTEQIKNIELQKGPNQQAMLMDVLDSKIVLMHDILPNIVHYGPKIIQQAKALGYRFVTVSECLGGVNPYFES